MWKSFLLWPLPDLRPLRYYYCAVSGSNSNLVDLSQSFWPELVRSTCERFRTLFLSESKGQDLTLFSNPPRSSTLPAFPFFWRGSQKCLHLPPTVFLRNLTERVDPLLTVESLHTSPPVCFILATYPKVSSPRAPRWRQRNQPACWGGAAFLFHNKTWTIIPTLGSLRVYVHPWLEFPFDFFLVAVTRIRASVSTPSKLTWRGIHSREQTQLLHTPRSTPSCIFIQDPSRRVEVLQGTHYSEYPPQKGKKMCLSGSVLLS